MARTGSFLKGVPDGWCARSPDTGKRQGAGVRVKDVDPASFKTVFYKKYPTTRAPKNDPKKATMGVTYGWVGKYKKSGPENKRCQGSMRIVRLMKPKARVRKSKSRGKYKCMPKR